MSIKKSLVALGGGLLAALALVMLLSVEWLGGPPAAAAAPTGPSAPAATITRTLALTPARDNTLYESEIGAISNGAGQYLFAGTTSNGAARRAVLAFDLGALPPGATVLTATLTLTMSKTVAGETAVALHALAADWGEGSSAAIGQEGAGATATPGDATWIYTFFNTAQWAAPGGDFDPTPSAVTAVGGEGVYQWASPALLADVAGWLADPAANFGWILVGDEATTTTAKRFDSRENDAANRPRLIVTYQVTQESSFVPVIMR